jgi:thiol-disulfide isomerase/thioredoxin
MRSTTYTALLLLALPLAALAGAQTGQPAPVFEGAPLLREGAPIRLEDYRGKVVYLDFWASWCAPCRVSLPLLEELRRQYQASGFEVIAVNVDENPEDALDFLKKYPVTYPIVRDPQQAVARLYDVPAMPTSYLIGRDGVVHAVKHGFKKNDMPKLNEAVAKLVKGE